VFQSNKLNLLIAVIAAIAIWAYVTTWVNPTNERTVTGVPVEFLNTELLAADGLVVASDSVAVNVVVEGTRSEVSSLTASDFYATANLKGFGLGTNYVEVSVTGPDRISVLEVNPERIEVVIAERLSVSKPIQLNFTKELPEGKEAGFVTLAPTEVDVSGEKANVDNVDHISVEVNPDDLRAEERTFQLDATPVTKDGDTVYDVMLSQTTIEVTLMLCDVKEVPLDIEIVGEPPDDKTVTKVSKPDTIFIRGSAEALANVGSVRGQSIDVSTLTESKVFTPDLDLPVGVELAERSADLVVNIEIGGVATKEFTFTADEIQISGLDEMHWANVNTASVTVTVYGTDEELAGFDKRDLVLYVDVSGQDYTLGFVDVPVKFLYEKDIDRVESEPVNVRVIVMEAPNGSGGSTSGGAVDNEGGNGSGDDAGNGSGNGSGGSATTDSSINEED
jgi:YbbR domain-containing protein